MIRRPTIALLTLALLVQGFVAVVPHHHEPEHVHLGIAAHDHSGAPCVVPVLALEPAAACLACAVHAPSVAEPARLEVGPPLGALALAAEATVALGDDLAPLPHRSRGPPVV